MFTHIDLRFTWIDVDSGESEECLFSANGQNGWDKGLGSALTYGERSFLLKFFHIATDEDDVDAKPIEEATHLQPTHTAIMSTPIQPGDGRYMKMMARIQSGELDMVEKALKAGMTFTEDARAMLEQAQRDYKPKQK